MNCPRCIKGHMLGGFCVNCGYEPVTYVAVFDPHTKRIAEGNHRQYHTDTYERMVERNRGYRKRRRGG